MKIKTIVFFIVLFLLGLFVFGCENVTEEQTTSECSVDSDCDIGGCSGQICDSKENIKDIMTTCEYLPEYGCLKKTTCGCVDGNCQWAENKDYADCMAELDKV